MMHFRKGGNWTDGVHAGLFSFTDLRAYHEIVAPATVEIEGLPKKMDRYIDGADKRDSKNSF